MGSCDRRHVLLPGVFRGTLSLDGSVLCYPVFVSSFSFHPGAVRNQRAKLGWELLYSSLSFSFGLRSVGGLRPRRHDAAVRQGLFPFAYCFFPFGYCFLLFIRCFLSLNQCFLAYIELRFALSKLRFSNRILFLTGADNGKRTKHRHDKHFFHIRSKPVIYLAGTKKTEAQWLVKRNLKPSTVVAPGNLKNVFERSYGGVCVRRLWPKW